MDRLWEWCADFDKEKNKVGRGRQNVTNASSLVVLFSDDPYGNGGNYLNLGSVSSTSSVDGTDWPLLLTARM